jgi:hypothetical protein
MESARIDFVTGESAAEPGKAKLIRTRKAVQQGWHAVSELVVGEIRHELAGYVEQFVARMPRPQTSPRALAPLHCIGRWPTARSLIRGLIVRSPRLTSDCGPTGALT